MISICQQRADAAHRLGHLIESKQISNSFCQKLDPDNSCRNNPIIPVEGKCDSVNFPKTLVMAVEFKRPDNNSYRRVKGIFIIVDLCLAHFKTTTLLFPTRIPNPGDAMIMQNWQNLPPDLDSHSQNLHIPQKLYLALSSP